MLMSDLRMFLKEVMMVVLSKLGLAMAGELLLIEKNRSYLATNSTNQIQFTYTTPTMGELSK